MTVSGLRMRYHAVGIHVSEVGKRVLNQSNGRVFSCVHLRMCCFDPYLHCFGTVLTLFGTVW